MSEGLDVIRGALRREAPEISERTRRQFVGASAAALGGMGLVGVLPGSAKAASANNSTQTILNVAATAEVLATIVNTVGFERKVVLGGRDDDHLLNDTPFRDAGACRRR